MTTIRWACLLTVLYCAPLCAQSFLITDVSPPAPQVVFLGSQGVCQAFLIEYQGPVSAKPTDIVISGLGSGNEATGLLNAQLWYDADSNGHFQSSLDTLVDTTIFSQAIREAQFSLASIPEFQPNETRRFFVVYTLSFNASDGDTFHCYVSAVSGASATGLPAPGLAGTPGIVVSSNLLMATMNGPSSPSVVNSDSQGPNWTGELLLDVSLGTGPAGDWTVTQLVFQGSLDASAGDHDTAFTAIDLWMGDGLQAQRVAPPANFVANQVVFDLPSILISAGAQRRFSLTGRMNGTAAEGQTFGASLLSVSAVPSVAGGVMSGIPTPTSSALVIGPGLLVVSNGPFQPPGVWHVAGSAAGYLVGSFEVRALNSDSTLNGFTLTTDGTGDWHNGVDPATGVRIFLDDGDGAFNENADTLLFQGGGGATINVQFTTPLFMPIADVNLLWIQLRLTDEAGAGLASQAETYVLEIADQAHIAANVVAVLGAGLPRTVELGAIEFGVSEFTPVSDRREGGRQITVEGSGFVLPVRVLIGGKVCPGTPIITDGVRIEGLTVPEGEGSDLPIVVESGMLPQQTVAFTFSYKSDKSDKNDDDDGCTARSAAASPAMLLLMAALFSALVAARTRKQN
jgi:hypothetical protein